ncbi:MAG: ATP-binding protein, partial [Gemmatimonadota bacterium]
LIPEENRSELQAALDTVLHTGRPAGVEYSLPFEDGERHFEARLLPHMEGQVITVVRDITDRQRAEQALRDSEEHFRRLIENSSDVATILGPDGINLYQSPSIQYVLGYTPDELSGTSAFERIHPDDAAACREVLGWIMQNPGETRSVDFRYRHKDGDWRVLEARARTLLPDSADAGLVINSRDITERRQYEEALEEAKEEAERANRAKSDFLSRMSHELRTPMNSILGFSQLLARRALEPEQRKGVDHILKAGRHLLNLINEVLEISRIEAGRLNFSLEPVSVETVVDEARALILPLAEQHGITLHDIERDSELYVVADRQRLAQVLLNLLSNAVKYNRPDGTVSISCGEDGEAGADRVLRIGVRDTGPGIPATQLDRMFVPFERLGAEQSEVEGTGLGLALSKRLVEAMGGTLTVESSPGQGSTFWISLARASSPTTRSERDQASAKAAVSADSSPRAKLLYIEDNLPNLTLVEAILAERPGIELLSAVQGRTGLTLALEHRPDLILLDLHLPDMHGDQVIRELLADETTRAIPIVIVSADATPRSVDRQSLAGAAAYLTKPIEVAEFLSTVDGILAKRRA